MQGKGVRVVVGMAAALVLMVAMGVRASAQMAPMTYDLRTEATLTGTVDDVMTVPGTGPMSGTHLALKTKTETIHVMLGPTAFVEKQGVAFAKGDQVSVVGSRIKGQGFEAILARTVTKGRQTITLRDEDGAPRWQ
jgi:hypothetical protein